MNKLNITINFDLDGTLCGLYDVPNWLEMLIAETLPLTQKPNPCSAFALSQES